VWNCIACRNQEHRRHGHCFPTTRHRRSPRRGRPVACVRGCAAHDDRRAGSHAIRQALDGQVGADSTVTQPGRTPTDRAATKVTIRLAPEVATALATRARAADVSQGHYVAGLLEGSPPPRRPSDHGDTVAALVKSTDALAGLRVDLNAFTRMMRMAGANGLAGQGADLDAMSKLMLEHVAIASRLIIGLQPSAHPCRERLAAPRTSKRSS
jgi:hypothetical protein